jgi:DNA gyrase inhibitor GyrI
MESKLEVRIEHLEPMTVASFSSYGPEPEDEGKKKVAAWMEKMHLQTGAENHRVFGFDTTGPTPATENRGYEYWVEVPADFESDGDVKIKHVPGGKYAVYRIPKFGNPWETIPAGWQALVLWQEDSAYKMGSNQCLERIIPQGDQPESECPMDLYLSIE